MHRCLILLYTLAACAKTTPTAATPTKTVVVAASAVTIDAARLAAFGILPAAQAMNADLVALGRALFWDPRLSAGGKLSCRSCHDLARYGVDGQPHSLGALRNAPSVYNAVGHVAQYWDGRAADLEAQAKIAFTSPHEMAQPNEAEVTRALGNHALAFKKLFPADKAPTTTNAAKAIAAFESQLLTPSRWDEFLGGKKDALTNDEKKGFNTFVESGCLTCHSGVYVGGHMYQKLGLVKPWTRDTDPGRMGITQSEGDKQFFKVPSLRNVEKTAPYMHDGSIATLEEAVKVMGQYQVGRELDATQVASIVTWLRTLTGTLPKS